jgi:hypothetical protein
MPFVSEAQMRTMAGIGWLGAMAGWFPTPEDGTHNGTGSHIFDISQGVEQFAPTGF